MSFSGVTVWSPHTREIGGWNRPRMWKSRMRKHITNGKNGYWWMDDLKFRGQTFFNPYNHTYFKHIMYFFTSISLLTLLNNKSQHNKRLK